MAVTGIIMAGGSSSRMGMDKGLAEIHGISMVELAFRNLKKVCDEILISTNTAEYQKFGVEIVPDYIQGIGPMGGLYGSLLRSKNEVNLVLSVDMPFVNSGLLKYLVDGLSHYQAVVPWYGGEHYEPLCACYRRSLHTSMEEYLATGRSKLPDLFRKISINKLVIKEDLPFYTDLLFFNVNSKEDLEWAKSMLDPFSMIRED